MNLISQQLSDVVLQAVPNIRSGQVRPPRTRRLQSAREARQVWRRAQITSKQRSRSIFRSCERRERDRRHLSSAFAAQRSDLPQELVSIGLRHANVTEQNVGSFRFDDRQCLVRRSRRENNRAAFFQHPFDQRPGIRFIVDNQNFQSLQRRAVLVQWGKLQGSWMHPRQLALFLMYDNQWKKDGALGRIRLNAGVLISVSL
jgi:hypothetical protein